MSEEKLPEKPKRSRRVLAVCAVVLLTFLALGVTWRLTFSSIYTRALRRAVAGTTRLRVCTEDGETLVEVTDAAQIREIIDNIRVKDPWPGDYGKCKCYGWPIFEFYRGKELLAAVSYHHGTSLRWDPPWGSDANLTAKSAAFLKAWLEEHGATEEQWQARQKEFIDKVIG